MDKFDFQKELKHLYASTKNVPTLVEVPKINFLMFDGVGHPNDKEFQLGTEAVFTISYLLKFEVVRKNSTKTIKLCQRKLFGTWTGAMAYHLVGQ